MRASVQPLNTTPFVSMALILGLIAFVTEYRTPRAIVVKLAERSDLCGVRPPDTVLEIKPSGTVLLNSSTVDRSQIGRSLEKIFEKLEERILYVKADSDVSFQNVAELIDLSQSHCDYVALATPMTEKMFGCLVLPPPPPFRDINMGPPILDLKPVPLWRRSR